MRLSLNASSISFFKKILLSSLIFSPIQSIILIERLLNNLSKVKEKIELNIFEKLDNKYKIFNLIINDLIRYTNKIKEQNITPTLDDIYEGIYSFKERTN